MPKLPRGRLDGGYTAKGYNTYTAKQLFAWADKLEKQIDDPENTDDPRWLRRWARKIRKLAEQKEKSSLSKKQDLHKQVKIYEEFAEDRAEELRDYAD